jgi:selenocysteine lyase/cysteine desulfurase
MVGQMNWEFVRVQFPALRSWTYLNSATYGQMPLRAQKAVERHFSTRDETACTDFLTWFDDADRIRGVVAELIGCKAEDIAFAMNAAAALSLFLGGIDWKPGDRIVTLRDEFPNQYYFAATLAERGVEVVELETLDSFPDRTRAICVSTVNYTTGYRPDLTGIAPLARERGALLFVDGTQSVGALRFDISAVQPDMFAVDPYKWLLAPNGGTFFYVSPGLRARLRPNVIGWRSNKGWRSVDDLLHGIPNLPDTAAKYEGGMLNFPSLYALEESVRMMLEIGPDRIEQRVLELAGATADLLRRAGAGVRHENSNIVAGYWADRDVSALARDLQEQRIVVSARHGNLRVSPHFYNTEEDLEKLEAALK